MTVRDANPGTFLDIRFTDFRKDWAATVRRIYDHFGLALTGDALAAMQAWHDAQEKGAGGGHRYTLADFGLDADTLRQRFAYYDAF